MSKIDVHRFTKNELLWILFLLFSTNTNTHPFSTQRFVIREGGGGKLNKWKRIMLASLNILSVFSFSQKSFLNLTFQIRNPKIDQGQIFSVGFSFMLHIIHMIQVIIVRSFYVMICYDIFQIKNFIEIHKNKANDFAILIFLYIF